MDTSLDVLPADRLYASVIQFLINRGERKAAHVLLSCESSFAYTQEANGLHAKITLRAPERIYRWLTFVVHRRNLVAQGLIKEDDEDLEFLPEALFQCFEQAFKAVLPAEISAVTIYPRAALIEINPEWRQDLMNTLKGTAIHNQGLPISEETPLHLWKNLRFRSQTEIRIAEALERVPVLFLPNCMARLGFSQRQNREADFLICRKGKWGILEVDGPFSHPPTRTVDDHERGRLFKAHGIHVIEHFNAGDCWEDPDGVVKKFLYILGQ
jgi:hypothetical protein